MVSKRKTFPVTTSEWIKMWKHQIFRVSRFRFPFDHIESKYGFFHQWTEIFILAQYLNCTNLDWMREFDDVLSHVSRSVEQNPNITMPKFPHEFMTISMLLSRYSKFLQTCSTQKMVLYITNWTLKWRVCFSFDLKVSFNLS